MIIRLYLIYTILCIQLCTYQIAYSLDKDTSLSADLNADGIPENITVTFFSKGTGEFSNTLKFSIKINNQQRKLEFELPSLWVYAEIWKIDESTNILSISAKYENDYMEHILLTYNGNKIINLGKFNNEGKIELSGDGIIRAEQWLGFWGYTENIKVDKIKNKIVRQTEQFYDVNIDASVNQSFIIYDTRDESSKANKLQSGSRITLIKSDVSPTECEPHISKIEEYTCDWYLIRTESGTEGWARLRTFLDKVEGLPWKDK